MEEEKKEKKKSGRITLTDNQERFCKMVVAGKDPLEAMLEIFPNRANYSVGNQRMLVSQMQKNPKIINRTKELFEELRSNEVLGDLYDFNKGVQLLMKDIEMAQKYIDEGKFSEAIHRVILTSVQELNRMYGFNVMSKNGDTNNSVNITFIDVDRPEGGVNIGGKK